MECPYCRSESVNQINELNRCRSCGEFWTTRQQTRIEELEKRIIDAGLLHLADEQTIRNLETQLEKHRSHSSQCGKWTCGFCGMHNSRGEWHCEICHHGKHVCGATALVEAVEEGFRLIERALMHAEDESAFGTSEIADLKAWLERFK